MSSGHQLFGTTIRRRGKPDVVLHFAVVDGRPECVGIEVGARIQPEGVEAADEETRRFWRLRPGALLDGELRPVTAEQIRGLGLGQEVRKALQKWSRDVRDLASGEFELPTGEPIPRRWREEPRERLGLAQAGEGRRGRPPLYDAEHFRTVARVYNEAQALGRTPTNYVAHSFRVSHSTATKWIERCRYDPKFGGLLPPTTRGRSTKATRTERRKAAERRN